ncbi:pentapeptide repeat-containing protein [Acinetobacter sp.]|uniref:pentapeptide repeat-containing protein n=1 Tax=Acinetobacter sp. TaxID=472 RepID=UPI003BAE669C
MFKSSNFRSSNFRSSNFRSSNFRSSNFRSSNFRSSNPVIKIFENSNLKSISLIAYSSHVDHLHF